MMLSFFFKPKKRRKRVVYIVGRFPQLSQTYIKNEIAALGPEYEVKIIGVSRPNFPDPNPMAHEIISDRKQILQAVKEFKPTVIHSHYVVWMDLVNEISTAAGIPYTTRSHSFDVLGPMYGQPHEAWAKVPHFVNKDNCLGLLCFPFAREALVDIGVRDDKIIDAPPVVATKKFFNRDHNGTAIINVGAALPKKKMDDFIMLSRKVRELEFNLYALGHISNELKQFNSDNDGQVNFPHPVGFDEMPSVYKHHGWLVYTACPTLKTVGWPMAIAEAQASGLGVCMANIRSDLREYVGDSGYFYDDIGELQELIRKPVDQARREAGFENAMKLDVDFHINKLTSLWDKIN